MNLRSVDGIIYSIIYSIIQRFYSIIQRFNVEWKTRTFTVLHKPRTLHKPRISADETLTDAGNSSIKEEARRLFTSAGRAPHLTAHSTPQ